MLALASSKIVNLTRFQARADATYVAPVPVMGNRDRPTAIVELSASAEEDSHINTSLVQEYDPSEKTVFIFDIDGTLRPTEIAYFIQHDALDETSHGYLKDLNVGNSRVMFLTGRPYQSMAYANIDHSFDIYCSSGYAKMTKANEAKNRNVEIPSAVLHHFERLDQIYDSLMKNSYINTACEAGCITRIARAGPWDMLFFLEESYYQDEEFKQNLKDELRKLLPETWEIQGVPARKAILIYNGSEKRDKIYGVPRIIDDLVEADFIPDRIFYFGDSEADFMAMKALKVEAERLSMRPFGKTKVVNVAVGDKIPDDPSVSYRLANYNAVNDFVGLAYGRLKRCQAT